MFPWSSGLCGCQNRKAQEVFTLALEVNWSSAVLCEEACQIHSDNFAVFWFECVSPPTMRLVFSAAWIRNLNFFESSKFPRSLKCFIQDYDAKQEKNKFIFNLTLNWISAVRFLTVPTEPLSSRQPPEKALRLKLPSHVAFGQRPIIYY